MLRTWESADSTGVGHGAAGHQTIINLLPGTTIGSETLFENRKHERTANAGAFQDSLRLVPRSTGFKLAIKPIKQAV